MEHRESARLWLVFFACVAGANSYCLFDPAYWDMLLGMFAQSHWLAQHDLNYAELLLQPGYLSGGPNIYSFCWLPSMVYGGMYHAGLPVLAINLIWHVTVWVCGATILHTVYQLIRPTWDRATCLLACSTLFSCPLFLSQTSTFNMESPVSALTILALSHNLAGRHKTSVALSTLAFHLHPRGVISLLGNGAVSVVHLLALVRNRTVSSSAAHSGTLPLRNTLSCVALHAVSFAVFLVYFKLQFTLNDAARPNFMAALVPQNLGSLVGVPEFTLVVGFFGLSAPGLPLRQLFGRQPLPEISPIPLPDGSISQQEHRASEKLVTACLLFVVAYVIFMLNVEKMLLRYHFILYPIVVVGLMRHRAIQQDTTRWVRCVLVIFILWNVSNYNGTLYRALLPDAENNGHVLERSMEYRADLLLNQELASVVASNFDLDSTVFVTHWPITQILAIPAAGYIISDRVDIVADLPPAYADVRPLSDIYRLTKQNSLITQKTPKDVVWIFSANIFSANYFSQPFSVAGNDELLMKVTQENRSIFIYRRPREFTDELLAKLLYNHN